ncbi:MAG TPA: DUF3857 domain-containing protein [Steroidobacteraceae bacterium]|nr:DUF3857 domain-containing protein [Steroidobacteraceae bacterium]
MTRSFAPIRRTLRLLSVPLCLLLASQSPAVAAESLADADAFSLSPQALYAAASAVRVPDGTVISIVELQEKYSFDADGSNVYTQRFVYKVLGAAGADDGWDELDIHWSPWREDKPQMRARVVAADGTVYTLDASTISESPAYSGDSATYSDERVLRAPLPGYAPGAVVETEIVLKERLPFVGAGNVRRSLFEIGQPIEHRRVILEAPDSIPLRHRLDAAPRVTTTRSTADGRQRWVFDGAPAPAYLDYVENVPGDQYQKATLTFSTGKSWQELAQAYSAIVAERLKNTSVNELAQRLTNGRTGREAKVAALVEYLNREIRYTGIEFDQSSVIPHTPAETLARRYGDCKDKSLLLVSLLRAADIPATLALLNVDGTADSIAELPGMGLFNHAIVYVPGEPALWIDATAETSRLNQVPDADRGRLALIVAPESTALTRIPETSSTDNVLEEKREIRLADYGPAAVTEISTPQGTFEADYRRAYADIRAKQTAEELTDYIKSEYSAERMSKSDRSDPKDFAVPFRLTLDGEKASRGYTSLNDAVLYIPIDGMFRTLPYDFRTRERTDEQNAKATHPEKKRTLDYLLPRPFSVRWNYRIVPPAGFEAASLPDNATRSLGALTFSESYSVDPDGAVKAELKLDTRQRRFTPDEYRKAREEVATMLERDSVSIKFNLKAHALYSQGQGREAFQRYRELVAQHPKDPIQHLRRAEALIEAGMGDAARAEVATAIKLDPKLALARSRQAVILQYDSIGRWHVDGADYPGAAAAYRAAISLDHDDHALVGNYAILLEHNDHGMRYGTGADLKGAIAAYRQLTSDQRQQLKIASNLAFALFYDRQYAAALEAANALESPPLALVMASDAQLNGTAHALAEVQRRSSSMDVYKQSAATAGNMLMSLREYQNAAALLEVGASGNATAPVMTLVKTLRLARKYEDLPKEDTPVGVLREAFVAVMTNTRAATQPGAYQSRNARAEWARLTDEQRGSEQETAQGMLNVAQRSGLPVSVLTDVAIQAMEFKLAGDDATGYRVTLQAMGMPTQTAFVVKEDGKYLVLAFKDWPAPIGTEIIERVQKGDLAGAATLLAWIRETSAAGEGSDDPYAAMPLTRFWAQGQRQGDANALRLAAASIWVMLPSTAERGVALLEQAKAGATDAQVDAIELALLSGYERLRDHARALAITEALAKRAPQSLRVFRSRSMHLRALNRVAEADALADERLKTLPDDIDALRARSTNAAAGRDYATAYDRGIKLLADPRATPSDSNLAAWHSLFFDREGGPDVDNAMRASQSREGGAVSAMHTLGCAYAEVGKTLEARSMLLQAMTAKNLTKPNSDYWYGFGRIAEQYGERDTALADYAKVKPPEDPAFSFTSSYELAQKRLKVLSAKGAVSSSTTR